MVNPTFRQLSSALPGLPSRSFAPDADVGSPRYPWAGADRRQPGHQIVPTGRRIEIPLPLIRKEPS